MRSLHRISSTRFTFAVPQRRMIYPASSALPFLRSASRASCTMSSTCTQAQISFSSAERNAPSTQSKDRAQVAHNLNHKYVARSDAKTQITAAASGTDRNTRTFWTLASNPTIRKMCLLERVIGTFGMAAMRRQVISRERNMATSRHRKKRSFSNGKKY